MLNQNVNVLVEIIHVCEDGPYILTWTILNLLPRTLAAINDDVELKGNPQIKYIKINLIVSFCINILI